MEARDEHDRPTPVQLHLVLPYKQEAREHPRIRAYLDDGYRIRQLQRVSDREVVVTLTAGPADAAAS